METYVFEISLPKRQIFRSEKFHNYKSFIRACEQKCKELHVHSDSVKIYYTSEYGNTIIRNPEHGEIMV